MPETEVQEPWKELLRLADNEQPRQLGSYLEQLDPSDVALAISRLSAGVFPSGTEGCGMFGQPVARNRCSNHVPP